LDAVEANLIAENERGENKYSTTLHTVTNPPGTYSSTQELLIELVCQRLLHDFQIVKSDSKSSANSNHPAPTSSFSRDWGGTGTASGTGMGGGGGGVKTARQAWASAGQHVRAQLGGITQMKYLLSKGAYYHRLEASEDGSHSVSITRYVPTKLR
jgi:hypothetical protein